jgi:CubicO group peptidase (beta-lactamase class C family)
MQALDTFLRQATDSGTVPGVVVCVASHGQMVWHQAYGAAALTPQYRPMQCNTLFDIASLTKVVATTSLLLLAHHEGVCHLDDALQHFYPQTRGTPLGSATVRQLLAHTGGLAAWTPLYQALLPDSPACHMTSSTAARRHQAIQTILQEPLAYPPGVQTLYSDLGFILLADIVETRYQQPLDRLFRERVAQPLGLHCSGYHPLAHQSSIAPSPLAGEGAPLNWRPSADAVAGNGWDGGEARGRESARTVSPSNDLTDVPDGASPLPVSPTAYAATEACPWRARVLAGEVHDENAWAMGGVAGHAGLFATAEALWRFTHALLETAAGRRDWLPPALLRASWQRHATPPGTTRALGWDTPTPGRSASGDYFSEQSIGHLGFTGCSLWIDLARQVTIILCTNRVHPSRQATGITSLRPAVHNLIMRALGVATT